MATLFDQVNDEQPAGPAKAGRRARFRSLPWPEQALIYAKRHAKRRRYFGGPECSCGACMRARADGWVDIKRKV